MQENSPNTHNPNESHKLRPGDRIYRVPRMITQHITLDRIRPIKPLVGVSLLSFVYGFAAMIAVGAVLLMLPAASNAGILTPFVDCLFTATSAVCLTGLAVVDTLDHWSLLGQIVILVLIQLGGLGFMTITTLLMIAAGRKIGLRSRILAGESAGLSQIGGAVRLTRNILYFSLLTEAAGAVVFFLRFSSIYPWPQNLWKSVFQAVSAFNNAGFDLYGGFRSLTGYNNDYLVILTTAVLIILGGISFVVINNLFHSRGLHNSTVDTKLVLLITLILLAAGTVIVLAIEYNNPQTLGNMPPGIKVLNAFFQSVVARTAGFNSLDTSAITVNALFVIMLLMYIGGSSGSTAGGIKVNTLGVIIITVWNTIRGKEHPGVFGREFPLEQIFRGMTLLVISLGLIGLVFFLLSITEQFPSFKILFETVSAFGTVGLSTGITPFLTLPGKLIIVFTMFIGRLGPLTLIMALSRAQNKVAYRFPKGSVRIG
jgi:trk system potassium uptake protein